MTRKRKRKSPKTRVHVRPVSREVREIIRHNSEQVRALENSLEAPAVSETPPIPERLPASEAAQAQQNVQATTRTPSASSTAPKPISLLRRLVYWFQGA